MGPQSLRGILTPPMPTDTATLPSHQHAYEGLSTLSEEAVHVRRETVYLVITGLFLGSLTMLNILGITRFLDLSFTIPLVGWTIPMPLAIGVLPYPVTFLCTDFISELYGRKRANRVVWVGFMLNVWVVIVLWVGGALPGTMPQDSTSAAAFFEVRHLAFGAVAASMIAYLAAQLIDVRLFHFWKRVTNGKHLWLRNNGSTIISQLVDTVAVILITHFYAGALPIKADEGIWPQLFAFITAAYVFKLVVALIDTVPFYLGAHALARYLRLPPPTHREPHSGAAAVEASVG